VKLFSRMLSIIVPCAIQFEMKTGGTSQANRLQTSKQDKKKMFEFEDSDNHGPSDPHSKGHSPSHHSHSNPFSFGRP
jgi:hypothetical protein